MTHVIDFYLDEQRHVERDDIIHCIAGGAQAEANLVGYVREALREYIISAEDINLTYCRPQSSGKDISCRRILID